MSSRRIHPVYSSLSDIQQSENMEITPTNSEQVCLPPIHPPVLVRSYAEDDQNIIRNINSYLRYMRDAHEKYEHNSEEQKLALSNALDIYQKSQQENSIEWDTHFFRLLADFLEQNAFNNTR